MRLVKCNSKAVARCVIFIVRAMITVWVIAMNDDRVIHTGMMGWTYRPNIGTPAIICITGMLLALSVWFDGRTRFFLLLSWLMVLAIGTHRLVEHSDGRVSDIWLTAHVQSLATSQPDDEARRCAVGPWVIRCEDRKGGGTVTTFSPIPFVHLS